ncbi:hypothetical protein LC55x_0847 [Lysobacter capsici]|uniref:Uncharacterized protein n=1 Tax=Lysobacter capsici AZ78 TaxID=1444315 RepID=A0A120AGJ4_9GAMM|nr:hypothetical protein LC55x_0847 [Lysobacter capsici]KWS04683.1 hypothetical protein AZ78_2233 [Lysobacter capsici AZ78]
MRHAVLLVGSCPRVDARLGRRIRVGSLTKADWPGVAA